MYLVKKGFANNTISAVKGKVITIKDKKLANSLLEAGYIAPYSNKEMTNKEKDLEIQALSKDIADKDLEIQALKAKIEELEQEKLENSNNLDNDNKEKKQESSKNSDNDDKEKEPEKPNSTKNKE